MILHHPITFQTFTAWSMIFCQPIICQTVTASIMQSPSKHLLLGCSYSITQSLFKHILRGWYLSHLSNTYCLIDHAQSSSHLSDTYCLVDHAQSSSHFSNSYCLVDHAQSSSHFSNTYCLVCHPFTFRHLLLGLSPSHLSNIMVDDTPSLSHLARAVATQNRQCSFTFSFPLYCCALTACWLLEKCENVQVDSFGINKMFSVGRFSDAGLHKWMLFVIFCARGRSVTSGLISEYALLHAVYNNGSWT